MRVRCDHSTGHGHWDKASRMHAGLGANPGLIHVKDGHYHAIASNS